MCTANQPCSATKQEIAPAIGRATAGTTGMFEPGVVWHTWWIAWGIQSVPFVTSQRAGITKGGELWSLGDLVRKLKEK